MASVSRIAIKPLDIRAAVEPGQNTGPWALYDRRQQWFYLFLLFLVSTSNYFDRYVISVVLEPIKLEFRVSDTMLGLLSGFCFAASYALFGLPVARWADRGNRRTVITIAIGVWSGMTVLCGFAQTFWQLALARVGMGIGESGAIPPAQSLIADYFPPERRATALALFGAAGVSGYLLGVGVGGSVAATYGWRSTFIWAGVPGLLLALLVRVFLNEPRTRGPRMSGVTHGEDIKEAMKRLLRKQSFLFALVGCVSYWLLVYGALIFIPSFLMRVLHASLSQVSVQYATVAAASSLIGNVCGGILADRLSRKDIRWLAWLPAATCVAAGPLYVFALWSQQLSVFMLLFFAGNLVLAAGLSPIFAGIHQVCGSRRRTTAIAIVLFTATLLGGGLGPLVTGALSDSLSSICGAQGLRYALMGMMTLLEVVGATFYLFGNGMPRDIEA